MSDAKVRKREEAIDFLHCFTVLLRNLEDQREKSKGSLQARSSWSIVGYHQCTEAARLYGKRVGFQFVLLGRLAQGALGNVCSTVQMHNPIPRALELKSASHCFATYHVYAAFSPRSDESFAIDDSVGLLDSTA